MDGYKTLTGNLAAALVLIITAFGIELTVEETAAFSQMAASGLIVFNVLMRHISKGKAGWRK